MKNKYLFEDMVDVFYSDKETYFKCKVIIEGASLDDSFVRLLLKFGDLSYMFQGKLDKNGKCKVKVPALKNTPSDEGEVILEVIADTIFFEPYSSKFIIKRSKSVTVEKEEDDDDINEKAKKPKVNVIKENSQIGFKDFYENFIRKKMNESVEFKKYKPSNNTLALTRNKAGGDNSEVSKIFMYYIDNILKY